MNYSKCFKISKNFLILFANKMLVFSVESLKMLVRIANKEDPDQTVSDLGFQCWSVPIFGRQQIFEIIEHLP